MPKFAANLSWMFTDAPFTERFARAGKAGFKAVEFLTPYDFAASEVASWQKAAGVETILFNLPPGDWAAGDRGMASSPGREKEFRSGVATALRYADALGTTRLHAMAGLLPAGADPARCRAAFVENLRYAARELARSGRTLLIEPINHRDMPGYFLSRQDEAHAIREEVGEPNLKVQMDFYHAQVAEGDLATTYLTHAAHIGHVQVASVPERNEPDDGEVNFRYLFRLLDDLGYDGWIGCEYRPRGVTEDGLGWMKEWAL
jgi:hydroxypyruvate isomerase